MRKYLSIAIVFFILPTLFSVNTFASWNQTFTAAGVKSYLPNPVNGVLIAVLGTRSENAESAGEALGAAIQGGNVSGLVMNDDALGDISALDDIAIVQKCGAYPIQLTAVIRVFSSVAGPDNAVVVFYDKAMNVAASFSAIDGTALAMSPTASNTQANASLAGTTVVKDTTSIKDGPPFEGGPQDETAKQNKQFAIDQYEKRKVFFEEWLGIYVRGDAVNSPLRWAVPYQGKDMILLKGADFYKAVERNDLATKYRRRKAAKIALLILGPTLIVTGAVLWAVGANAETGECHSRSSIDNHCTSYEHNKVMIGVGNGLTAAGFFIFLPSLFIQPHPVTAGEAHRLVQDYDRKLRQELGLSEEDINTPKKVSAVGPIEVEPFLIRDGAGLALSARFNLSLQ
jgi:hypothetical protein